jgi:thioredoxin 1
LSDFSNIISGDTPVLVDFYANWCGPCKIMSPIVDEIKNEFGNRIRVLKIDVDKNAPVATKFKIKGIPTLLLFKQGEIVWRNAGVVPKDELIQVIKLHSV